jgi:hypothetical protein
VLILVIAAALPAHVVKYRNKLTFGCIKYNLGFLLFPLKGSFLSNGDYSCVSSI